MYVSALRFTYSVLSLRRFSILSVLLILCIRSANMNSRGCATIGKSCRSRTYSEVPSRSSVNTQSPLEGLVMSIKGR